MKISKALTVLIGDLDQPVLTEYDIGLFLFRLYREGRFGDEPLQKTRDIPSRDNYRLQLGYLSDSGIILPRKEFPSGKVFQILGKKHFDPFDVICSVDPFSYISHLSAMSYHGLSDRIPSTLYYSTPAPKDWKTSAEKKMRKDLGKDYSLYVESNLPTLIQHLPRKKIDKLAIHKHTSKDFAGGRFLSNYKNVSERVIRVATIGRTFLDMIHLPDLCGGLRHVIDVYGEQGEKYFTLVFQEIDSHGGPIDKIRAGYLLSEVAEVGDPLLDKWLKHVQRGGSRKLDANAEYSPVFSEKWCLSINID